jgi:ADP-ribose pyrophosphatase
LRIVLRLQRVFPFDMGEKSLRPWTTVSSRYRIDEPFLRLRCDTVELPNGMVIENYFVRESHGFAIVLAVTPDERIVLVRQYKHGIGRIVVELPAGMIDPGEDPAAAAVRELAEETGFVGDPPQLLRSLFADPTSSDGIFHIYAVCNARPALAQQLDPSEDIVVETVSRAEFSRFVRDGTLASGPQVAAGYIALDFLAGA